MNSILIQLATTADVEAIAEIASKTFFQTYALLNSQKDMDDYLFANFSIQNIRKEVENAGSQFYLAYVEEQVIGYLKINFGEAQTDLQDKSALEIERIYILKEFQGKSAGQLLFTTAMDIAKIQGCEYVWLGVLEKNAKAIGFYKKNGFVEFDQHLFKLGDEIQTDLLMKKQVSNE